MVPPTVLHNIQKLMPGIDVAALASTPTAADRAKAARSSGGGRSGISFSSSQLLPDGKPIAMDQFLAQKMQDYQAANGGGMRSVEVPKEQKALWEKEYNAMKVQMDALSPVQIQHDLAQRSVYFPNVTSYEAADKQINLMLQNGEYAAARQFLDSVGKPLSDTAAKPYKQLGNIKSAFNEIDVLLDRIQDKVGPFPTQGPLWSWMNENLETDPDYQRLLVIRGTTSAQYAKGVSGEAGALTDPDILRAAAGVINPNVSYSAMRAGIQQARQFTDIAIQNNIGIDRANGRIVSDIEEYLQGQSSPEATMSSLSPEQKDFLYK